MIKKINIFNSKNLKLSYQDKYFHSLIIDLPVYSEDMVKSFSNIHFNPDFVQKIQEIFDSSLQLICDKGLLFIYGSPSQLMKCYEYIPDGFKFRYWIAIDSINTIEKKAKNHLKHNHLGILMLSKGGQFLELDTKNTRIDYIACSACKRNIKDWGGKKHLMNIKGTGISDVWKDFYDIQKTVNDPDNNNISLNIIDYQSSNNYFDYGRMPDKVLKRLLALLKEEERNILYLNIDKEYIAPLNLTSKPRPADKIFVDSSRYRNKLLHGDCIAKMEEIAREYPDGIFDLVFADPPYNLDKSYNKYNDELSEQQYIEWCNKWLELCVKLTKPTGNILILNIPKWALEHARLLNSIAYFQNWIVWDALSLPKGKIMPAHYALLAYSKAPNGFTYNKPADIDSLEYCLRANCIKTRKNANIDNKVPVSDIWWDIHRIKHKIDRDDHPCQLPDKLMDRIIQSYSNEGDLVFDPFCGAGTTAISALKNNRKYTTIELDEYYLNITAAKLEQIEKNGKLDRVGKNNKAVSVYTKKELETKVQAYSQALGRRPTLNEFVEKFLIDIEQLKILYPEPHRVLKAGRIALLNDEKQRYLDLNF
ncbi:MAG: site-specific DNA-methyltransferase [Candidatus Acididesulfobacter guangdongensis]|uniref:Site-specific DNA-methyltransferase n=1 Tax=Acididesulfobacter guangdongensis TaxID=2597225 RepID=A0A519BHF3_ACIG2|nr:MAG: site-specific DNA-methyltransferase [Candidatus Acididesulfobacter guangdongensis]